MSSESIKMPNKSFSETLKSAISSISNLVRTINIKSMRTAFLKARGKVQGAPKSVQAALKYLNTK
jgi:hypothetical protein